VPEHVGELVDHPPVVGRDDLAGPDVEVRLAREGVPADGLILRVTSSEPKRRLKAIWVSSSIGWSWKTSTECSSKAARIAAQVGSSSGRVMSAPSIRAAKHRVSRVTVIVIAPF
jgi:hypothetical protein